MLSGTFEPTYSVPSLLPWRFGQCHRDSTEHGEHTRELRILACETSVLILEQPAIISGPSRKAHLTLGGIPAEVRMRILAHILHSDSRIVSICFDMPRILWPPSRGLSIRGRLDWSARSTQILRASKLLYSEGNAVLHNQTWFFWTDLPVARRFSRVLYSTTLEQIRQVAFVFPEQCSGQLLGQFPSLRRVGLQNFGWVQYDWRNATGPIGPLEFTRRIGRQPSLREEVDVLDLFERSPEVDFMIFVSPYTTAAPVPMAAPMPPLMLRLPGPVSSEFS